MKKTNKPMKKRTKIFLKVLLALAIIIALFIAVTTVISAIAVKSNINMARSFSNANTQQLSLDYYENGCWNIKSDNGLNVMQLTDVHIGGGWLSIKKDSMAINAVASMITAEKPDLVVVTGDVSYPVPFQAGTFNNKSAAKIFAELMETLGVYWTLGYGNHDTEVYSYYSREQLTEFYGSGNYPHCLLQGGPNDVDGEGNQVLNIVNSDGVITRSLIILDSHSYTDGDYFGIKWMYDNIHDNQIEWYKSTVKSIKDKNSAAISALSADKALEYTSLAENIPSSVFFHIPMEEYKDAWKEYANNDYQDTDNVKYIYGAVGEANEAVFCPVHSDNLFETMLSEKSTDSVFCGHDHFNNFSLNYKGINLTYGMSIDYLAYFGIMKLGTQRGCTLINYDKNGAISYNQENYYQDKYSSNYQKEAVTMQNIKDSADGVMIPGMPEEK